MNSRMIRALECVLLGLLILAALLLEATVRPSIPGRPVSLTLVLPAGFLMLGAAFFPLNTTQDRIFKSAAFRLLLLAVAVFALSPFFVWQFPLYERLYFLICGLAALLGFQFFLITLAQIIEACFALGRRDRLARFTRLVGISVTPFMMAITIIIYYHAFQSGLSPYAVWSQVLWVLRGLYAVPFLGIVVLLTTLLALESGVRDFRSSGTQ